MARTPVVKVERKRSVMTHTAGLPLPEPPVAALPTPERPYPRVLPAPTTPQVDGDDVFNAVVARITMGNREDFVKLTAEWLKCKPDQESLTAYAQRYPDRYMQGLTMAARMAGLADKATVEHSHTLIAFVEEISNLSDAELFSRKSKIINGEVLSSLAIPHPSPA